MSAKGHWNLFSVVTSEKNVFSVRSKDCLEENKKMLYNASINNCRFKFGIGIRRGVSSGRRYKSPFGAKPL